MKTYTIKYTYRNTVGYVDVNTKTDDIALKVGLLLASDILGVKSDSKKLQVDIYTAVNWD